MITDSNVFFIWALVATGIVTALVALLFVPLFRLSILRRHSVGRRLASSVPPGIPQ